MFFTLWNVMYVGGIIFFIIGALNLIQSYGQSLKKIIICVVLAIVGLAGFWFGDEGRRKETFQFEIDTEAKDTSNGIRELPTGNIQVIFNGDRTKVPSGQLTIDKAYKEKFIESIKEDEDGTYVELTRDEYRRYTRT